MTDAPSCVHRWRLADHRPQTEGRCLRCGAVRSFTPKLASDPRTFYLPASLRKSFEPVQPGFQRVES